MIRSTWTFLRDLCGALRTVGRMARERWRREEEIIRIYQRAGRDQKWFLKAMAEQDRDFKKGRLIRKTLGHEMPVSPDLDWGGDDGEDPFAIQKEDWAADARGEVWKYGDDDETRDPLDKFAEMMSGPRPTVSEGGLIMKKDGERKIYIGRISHPMISPEMDKRFREDWELHLESIRRREAWGPGGEGSV